MCLAMAVARGICAGPCYLLGILAPHPPLLGRERVLGLSRPEIREFPPFHSNHAEYRSQLALDILRTMALPITATLVDGVKVILSSRQMAGFPSHMAVARGTCA